MFGMASTAAIVASAGKLAFDYIKADQKRQYGLVQRASVALEGVGVGKYHYQDEVLGILSPSPDVCVLTSDPFTPASDNWNGPDILPDNLDDGSFGMSLWHDLVVKRAKKIAKANGCTEQDVFAWANGLVQPLMRLYAKKPPKPWWTRAIYSALEAGRPYYHPLKKLLGFGSAATAAALLCLAGCKSPPDWVATSVGEASAIVWQLGNEIATNAPPAASSQEEAPQADGTPQTPGATGEGQSAGPGPAAASVALDFRFGGFDGSRASEDPATQIGSVKMSRSGMSYKWVKGDLGNWGLAREAAGALACAFYWDEKSRRWVGGKFDWVSTSRTTRDFKNINEEHYNGWNPDAFWGAKRRAFCIVSRDGKKRTNLAEDGK